MSNFACFLEYCYIWNIKLILFKQNNLLVSKQSWCFTSTETIRLIRDGQRGGDRVLMNSSHTHRYTHTHTHTHSHTHTHTHTQTDTHTHRYTHTHTHTQIQTAMHTATQTTIILKYKQKSKNTRGQPTLEKMLSWRDQKQDRMCPGYPQTPSPCKTQQHTDDQNTRK